MFLELCICDFSDFVGYDISHICIMGDEENVSRCAKIYQVRQLD